MRGAGSIPSSSQSDNPANEPIYVVDGAIINKNSINMDDVENINGLKGPAATALYGSRGGAGAVSYTHLDGIVQNELSVGTDLGIISGFELSVPCLLYTSRYLTAFIKHSSITSANMTPPSAAAEYKNKNYRNQKTNRKNQE